MGGDHYKSLPVQPGHYVRKNNLGWYEGNIVKYITRHKQKGQMEDILKVIHYAELILEEYGYALESLNVVPISDNPDGGGDSGSPSAGGH